MGNATGQLPQGPQGLYAMELVLQPFPLADVPYDGHIPPHRPVPSPYRRGDRLSGEGAAVPLPKMPFRPEGT